MSACSRIGILILLLAAAIVPALQSQNASTQPKPSQRGSVSQQIAAAKISVDYSRPVARGRELFGKLVPFGRIWNPGADEATNITVSTAVRINGQALPAGSYTIWADPGPEQWAIIFSKAHPVFHIPYPGAGKDALRLTVRPRAGAHMETLAFYFPVVDGRKGELVLHWGTVVVPLQIDVP